MKFSIILLLDVAHGIGDVQRNVKMQNYVYVCKLFRLCYLIVKAYGMFKLHFMLIIFPIHVYIYTNHGLIYQKYFNLTYCAVSKRKELYTVLLKTIRKNRN